MVTGINQSLPFSTKGGLVEKRGFFRQTIDKIRSFLILHGFAFRMSSTELSHKMATLKDARSWEVVLSEVQEIAPELEGRLHKKDMQVERVMKDAVEVLHPQKQGRHPIKTKEDLMSHFALFKDQSQWDLTKERNLRGCAARSTEVISYLRRQGVPMKQVTSELLMGEDVGTSVGGKEVVWTWHIAAAVTLEDGTKWVIDPSISREGPLSLEEWTAASLLGNKSYTRSEGKKSEPEIISQTERNEAFSLHGNLDVEPTGTGSMMLRVSPDAELHRSEKLKQKLSINKTSNATKQIFKQFFVDHSTQYPLLSAKVLSWIA